MKSVIVGTAGHIDHGKTALVKALTGIDADRLEEEKRRGITIDIGFAHLELPGPGQGILRLGFVDVPGHERFVRNMLAGVAGIDLVLLVIAADESIKPQTREHFDICRLLSVRRGITVLTKCDLVDRETLDVVKLEVEDFLRGSFLDGSRSPLIPVSALTGAGLDGLRDALVRMAADSPARDSNALPRLPIDRVFTMKGFGTVVTGTLVSGTIHKENEAQVFPSGQRVRVRGIQVHGKTADQAVAGERTALNLAGASTVELSRGMSLAPPATFHSTARADVSLSLLQSARPLKNRARVHLHIYTSETIAEVVLEGGKTLEAGRSGLAQLRLADPTLILPGDRFIIRQFSPVVTIGGGLVLDANPLGKSFATSRDAFLRILEGDDRAAILLARIARRGGQGLSFSGVVAETGWPKSEIETLLKEPLRRGLVALADDVLVESATLTRLEQLTMTAVREFQGQNPLEPGLGKEILRKKLKTTPAVSDLILRSLVSSKNLEVRGELVRLPGQGVVMKDEEAESKKTIESAFEHAGLKVPALHEVLSELKVDRVRAQKIVTLLLRDKVLVKIADNLVFHQHALEDLRRKMAAEKTRSPRIDVARFKDLTGVSRKYAIPLLEYLDREHVTRRLGNERLIL
jgi:selenocysteine-specific elongation factor